MVATAVEVLNAVVLSFVLSEVLLSEHGISGLSRRLQSPKAPRWMVAVALSILGLLNVLILVRPADPASAITNSAPSILINLEHKGAFVLVAFVGLCVAEARRIWPSATSKELFKVMLRSGGLVVVCFPGLAILVSLVVLIFTYFTDFLGVPHKYLNDFVFYSIFHGPFFTLHFFVKRQCLREQLARASHLPVTVGGPTA
eukprot:m.29768 g.29768  ORF g.29768 m.29768 type:complete len:200 (-) comp6725_c0_seq2:363-962(-)